MSTSNLLILIGSGIALLGVALRFFPGLFSWFGHLPGDIRYESGSTQVFIPITSMLVLSVVVSVVWSLASRLFRGQ